MGGRKDGGDRKEKKGSGAEMEEEEEEEGEEEEEEGHIDERVQGRREEVTVKRRSDRISLPLLTESTLTSLELFQLC